MANLQQSETKQRLMYKLLRSNEQTKRKSIPCSLPDTVHTCLDYNIDASCLSVDIPEKTNEHYEEQLNVSESIATQKVKEYHKRVLKKLQEPEKRAMIYEQPKSTKGEGERVLLESIVSNSGTSTTSRLDLLYRLSH